MLTSNDIANQALLDIGGNTSPVTGFAPTFDNSTAGIALQTLYPAAVASVAREWQWDLARNTVALTLSGNPAPSQWLYEYLYPANGIQVWQLIPPNADPNNPLPVNYDIANAIVSGAQAKVIHTNFAGAICVYNNNPNENTWDPLFRESVVRLLASQLAMALFGRPDTSQAMLETGAAFESLGETRDD